MSLVIDAGQAQLMDAGGLWGLDTYETDDVLQVALGRPGSWTVSCIGPAGEKCSLLAGIVNEKGRNRCAFGRGSRHGFKRLKAVAVRAAKGARVHVADKESLRVILKDYRRSIRANPFLQMLSTAGTGAGTSFLLSIGDCPTTNWRATGTESFPTCAELDGAKMDAYKQKGYGCSACPVRCGALVKVGNGPFASQGELHRPEYETLASLGANCRNDNVESIIRANEICNRYGIDTIGVGAFYSFAMECYQNGLLDSADTGGLNLDWGNAAAIVALTEQIAKREGLGELLADGTRRAAEHIGKGSEEYAMHVGGRELPYHDPRLAPSQGTFYISDAQPANHCGPQGMAHLEQGACLGPHPLLQSQDQELFGDYEQKGDCFARGAAFWQLLSSAGLCSLFAARSAAGR